MKKFIIAILAMTALATATQAVYHKNLPVGDSIEVLVTSGKIPNKSGTHMVILTNIFVKGAEKHVFDSIGRISPGEVYCYDECFFMFNRDLGLVFRITKELQGGIPVEPIFECDGITYSYEDTLVNVQGEGSIMVSWK